MAQERAREQALERLVALLEASAVHAPHEHAETSRNRTNRLNQLARLRSARASYALTSSAVMERVGPGAWIRRRQPLSDQAVVRVREEEKVH